MDKMGNRVSVVDTGNTKSYTPNNLNEYSSVADGIAISNNGQHQMYNYNYVTYSYRNDEQLTGAVRTNPSISYSLAYDALGRCVARTTSLPSPSPTMTKYYIYDGERPIVEYDGTGNVTAKNVYGKGIDEILMRTDYTFNPARTYYFHQDHEGSVIHLTDTTGALIERYRYDVFGAPTIYGPSPTATPFQPQASAVSNRFMFTGREYAGAFGFYEYRARTYHPSLGRFTSEDPKLFVRRIPLGKSPDDWSFGAHPDEAEFNLFRYCGNDPIDFTDPMGLYFTITGGDRDWLRKTAADLKKAERDLVRATKDGVKGAAQALKDFRALKNDKDYEVKIVPAGQTPKGVNNYGPNTKTIGYEAYKANNATARDADGSLNRDASVGLGHEVGHALDDYFGRLSYGPANDPTRFPNRGEERAVEFENVIRAGRWPDDPGRQRPQF